MVSYGFDKALATTSELDTGYGQAASLAMAREGIVLLKNGDGEGRSTSLLPLAASAKIAVIGDLAYQAPSSPFGTAWSPANTYITGLGGLQQLNNDSSNVTFIPALSLNATASVWYQAAATNSKTTPASGVTAEYFSNTELSGDPVLTRTEPGVAWDFTTGQNVTDSGTTSVDGFATTGGAFSARFTGTIKPTVTGPQVFKVRADGAYKLWVDGNLILDFDGASVAADVVNAKSHSAKTVELKAGQYYTVKLEYRRLNSSYFPVLGSINGIQMSWASLTAPADLANYDAVVIATGINAEYEGEGSDHEFDLPEYQSDLITSVNKVNSNTVVIMHGGSPFNMLPWSKKTGAVLEAWYSGQYAGQALAEIIYGKVNPSGKLPVTIGQKVQDYPSYASYPSVTAYQPSALFGSTSTALTEMKYSEGIYTGYRGFDKNGIKPLYPFGYGLSYTTYDYSDMKLSSNKITAGQTINATFTLTNSGKMDGFEVAQLYVRPVKSKTDRPLKELKGFAKVYLKAGESKQVTIPIDSRSLSYYVASTDSWNVDAGSYKIQVGSSSADLPLTQTLQATTAQQLPTNTSNPLPLPMQQAVQVSSDQVY
jgi:beta-glucosidase